MDRTIVMTERVADVDLRVDQLTRVEQERAESLVFRADREAFIAAHILTRWCASVFLGTSPWQLALRQRCPVHGEGHGRPYLQQAPLLGVTLSHTRGTVAAAVGPGRVGVDVERIPRMPLAEGLAGHILNESETAEDDAALLRLWTRKETMIKRGELSLGEMASVPWRPPPYLMEWQTPDRVLVCVAADSPLHRMRLSDLAVQTG